MDLLGKIESILFVASKPVTIARLAKALGASGEAVAEAIESLAVKYSPDRSGIVLLRDGVSVQMATNSLNAVVIDGFVKDEVVGELTRAQLETVTVIAYRGPITRPELEQIRGVNCAVIIRNLLMRGLIEEISAPHHMLVSYVASVEALRHLGVTTTSELPEYDTLRAHAHIEQVLEDGE